MTDPLSTLLAAIGRNEYEPCSILSQAPGETGLRVDWTTCGEAHLLAEQYAGTRHIWFGVQQMLGGRPVDGGRGKSRDVTGVVCLYADLDYVSAEKPGGVEPAIAMAIINRLSEIIGAEVTAIVASGNGCQPYWALSHTLDPLEGALLLVRWRQLVIQVAAEFGVTVDTGVYDLPRILRSPLGPNLKHGRSAPTGLIMGSQKRASVDRVIAGLDSHVAAVEDSGLRWASGTIREAREQDGVPRIFTDEQAQAFLEEHSWRRARETPWGAGADFWKVIWECALVASCFIEMYDEDDLREGLRQAIRDGHDGADPDMNDEYQIHLGFIKGRTFSARRPLVSEQTNPFHLAFVAPDVSALRQDWRVSEIQGATDYVMHETVPGTSQDQDVDEPWTPHSALAGDGQLVLPPGMIANPFAPGAKTSSAPRERNEPTQTGPSGGGRKLDATRASAIKPESCDWLWEYQGEFWIPLGGLVLLGGREGVGKSTWTARLVAQITNGKMHGEFLGKPRSVVISATEDAWPQTIIPRLMAAGADLDRVIRVNAVENDTATGLSLPHDVPALAKLIWDEEVAMVVLDPLLSTIGGPGDRLDTHKDSDVRKALEPISLLASDSRATFLGLIHQNKMQGGDLSTRMMGSRAFLAVARAALVCIEAPPGDEVGGDFDLFRPNESETPRPPRSFLFGQLKNNLGPRVETTVRYEIEGFVAGHDEARGNKPIRTSKIKVTKYKDVADVEETALAKDALAREKVDKRRAPEGNAVERCKKFLEFTLAGGPMLGSEVKVLVRASDFSDSTLKKASSELGIQKIGTYHNPDWALASYVNANTESNEEDS